MTEQYQVTIQSQMGPREGVLTLSYQGNYVTGSLDLVGYVNTIQGVRAATGRFISSIPSRRRSAPSPVRPS